MSDGRGAKWSAISAIVVCVITSGTAIALTLLGGEAQDEKIEQSATGTATDVVWLKERVQQCEVGLAVEKALREAQATSTAGRFDRLENRVFRGSRVRPASTDAEGVDVGDLVARAKEDVEKKRPPKPAPMDERVQQTLDNYLGAKK